MNMFRTRYRIVRDNYAGYEVQFRWWWCPVWIQASGDTCVGVNTWATVAAAVKFAEKLRLPHVVEKIN